MLRPYRSSIRAPNTHTSTLQFACVLLIAILGNNGTVSRGMAFVSF